MWAYTCAYAAMHVYIYICMYMYRRIYHTHVDKDADTYVYTYVYSSYIYIGHISYVYIYTYLIYIYISHIYIYMRKRERECVSRTGRLRTHPEETKGADPPTQPSPGPRHRSLAGQLWRTWGLRDGSLAEINLKQYGRVWYGIV